MKDLNKAINSSSTSQSKTQVNKSSPKPEHVRGDSASCKNQPLKPKPPED